MLFHNSHELRNKSLQMEDNLGAHPDPVFVERRPLNNIRFQGIINMRNELERQGLENSRWRNAMREQIVEFGSDLEDSCWGMLFDDLSRNLADQSFPVRRRDGCLVVYFLAVTASTSD